jgi:hypothetical protein
MTVFDILFMRRRIAIASDLLIRKEPDVSGRLWGRAFLANVVLLALLMSFAAEGLARQAPLPEGTKVITEGVDRVPRRSATWRVTRREVTSVTGSPSFILAETEPITVTWEDGRQHRLDPGDAVFLRKDEAATVARDDGELIPFHTIELVPAGFAGFGGFTISYVGESFPAPAGERTIELLQGTLEPGGSGIIDPGAGKALLSVTEGTIEIRYGRGDEIVAAGSAATLLSNAELAPVGAAGATFLVARIGAEVPDEGAKPPTDGEVGVTLYDCPPEMRPETVEPSQCTFTAGPIIDLQLAPLGSGDAAPRTLRDARLDGEVLVWEAVPFDEYVLQARSLHEDYDRFLIPDLEGLNTPPEAGYTASPNEGYLVTVDEETPTYDLPVYLFRVSPASLISEAAQDYASRTLRIFAALCPAGYAGESFADECGDTPVVATRFRVGRPLTDFFTTALTDDEGVVNFDIAGLPLEGTIRIVEELAPETARFVTSCVDEDGNPLDITYEDFPENIPPIGVADVSVGETGDVRCDWYEIPATAV